MTTPDDCRSLPEKKLQCKNVVLSSCSIEFLSECLTNYCTAEQGESTRLRGDLEYMKDTLRTSENRLQEVTEQAEPQIVEARAIRRDADQELMQAMATIQ
jgi:hypothetical protein